MYFWNVKALKKEIETGSFTDKDLIPYIVLYIGAYSAGIELMSYMPYEDINEWTYLASVLNILIPVIGTIFTYICNGGSKGNNFASKYFSIGFVVGIRFLIYFIPLLILLVIYWETMFPGQEDFPNTIVDVALFSAWYCLLY